MNQVDNNSDDVAIYLNELQQKPFEFTKRTEIANNNKKSSYCINYTKTEAQHQLEFEILN